MEGSDTSLRGAAALSACALSWAGLLAVARLRRRKFCCPPKRNGVVVVLVDNGSLKPPSTIALRRVAERLSEVMGMRVVPASARWSNRVDKSKLGGVPAKLLDDVLAEEVLSCARVIVLPYFIGPSKTVTKFIASKVDAHGDSVILADCLACPEDKIAGILADQVLSVADANGLSHVQAIIVDHGSPTRAVAAVRDRVAHLVQEKLRQNRGKAATAVPASMERRPGDTYAFADPLLECALEAFSGTVIAGMLFLSPGRHAGPGGDVDQIIADASCSKSNSGALTVLRTPLLGEVDDLIDILKCRVLEAIGDNVS